MGGGYQAQRTGVDALVKRINDLETKLDSLQKSVPGIGMQIDTATSTLVLPPGKSIRLLDDTGRTLILLGENSGGNTGLTVYRPDGSQSLHVDQAGFAGIFDKNGQVVISDDFENGGLATPHLPLAMLNSDQAHWPQTTASSWTTIAQTYFERQQPYLAWYFLLLTDASTTGQYRLLVNSIQVGTTQTAVNATSSQDWEDTQQITDTLIGLGSSCPIELQAQRTAGTGNVYAIPQFISGTQSP